MKVAIFDTHKYEKETFEKLNQKYQFDLSYYEVRLNKETVQLCQGYDVIVCFVNDRIDQFVISQLAQMNVGLIATRSAGFNHIDIEYAKKLKIPVVRVPEYSPHAVAEFAVSLLLTLNRKIHKSYLRVHELNFSLEGLTGFDLYDKTVGVIGTGKIGKVFTDIMIGFGCKVLAYDQKTNSDLNPLAQYCSLEKIYRECDVISLHVPLNKDTKHLINDQAISQMKSGVFLINTGRGGLIDTQSLIYGLKSKKIGAAALDVYEEEEGIFFEDHSTSGIDDDLLARLITFPNVLMTSHQAFLTHEALTKIGQTTFESIQQKRDHLPLIHSV